MRAHTWSFVLILLLVFAYVAAPTASVQAQCVEGLTETEILDNDDASFCSVTPSALCYYISVPLTSPWVAALLVALLVFVGLWLLRRRTKAANAMFTVILMFAVLISSFYITALSVQAHELTTSDDHDVVHYHRTERELTPGEKQCISGMVSIAYPNAEETSPPTVRFNAHGYTFDGGNCWILGDQVASPILPDDYTEITAAKQVGDVIVYWNGPAVIGSGIVRVVDGVGDVDTVECKWGIAGTYRHAPDYGVYADLATDTLYYRYTP